jgi:hypothetical protein
MALRDALARLQFHAGTLPGVKEAPVDPPESANQFPFAVSFVTAGSWHVESQDFSHALITFATEIHVARTNLPRDIQIALPLFEGFLRALLKDQTLNGNVDTIGTVTFAFGRLEYGGIETIGWRFDTGETKITLTS